MTVTLIHPDGSEEFFEDKLILKDLTKNQPSVYLLDMDSNITIRKETFTLVHGKKYRLLGCSSEKKSVEIFPKKETSLITDEIISSLEKIHLQHPKTGYSPKNRRQIVSDPVNCLSKRTLALNELIESEKRYLQKLIVLSTCIRDEFIRKSQSSNNLGITRDNVDRIFKDLKTFVFISQFFTDNLDTAVCQHPGNPKVGLICKEFANSLMAYSPFISDYKNRLNLLKQMQFDNPKLCSFIKQIELAYKDELERNCLSSVLINPVQRVPRYLMLFENLKKFSKNGTLEYELLQSTVILCKEALDNFEMASKKVSNANAVYDETKNIIIPESMSDFQMVKQNRSFIFKEEVKVSVPGSPKSSFVAIAFNDCVFFVTKGKNQILQKYFINNTIQYFNRTDNSIEIAIVADKIRLIVITPPLESIDKWFEYLNANVSSQPKDDLFLNPRSNTTKFNSKKRKPFKSLRSRTSKKSIKQRKKVSDSFFSAPSN